MNANVRVLVKWGALAKTTDHAAADEPVVGSAGYSAVDPDVNLSPDTDCQHRASLDRPHVWPRAGIRRFINDPDESVEGPYHSRPQRQACRWFRAETGVFLTRGSEIHGPR